MYNIKRWQDHVTEFENRYREVENSDGTFTHEPVEGEVIQEGTPQNAKNFNNIEEGVLSGIEVGAASIIMLIHARQAITDLKGEIIEIILTNSLQYPFNNSIKTLALNTKRENINYTVEVEASSNDNGSVGDIVVSDKQLNGFKIEHTGSSKSVSIKCYIKGGLY